LSIVLNQAAKNKCVIAAPLTTGLCHFMQDSRRTSQTGMIG
jgi:hypothetical protein